MKSIEEIKIELTLKMLANDLDWIDFSVLPKDDELRTFACSLGPKGAYLYAQYVDEGYHSETKEAVSKYGYYKVLYGIYIDKSFPKGFTALEVAGPHFM